MDFELKSLYIYYTAWYAIFLKKSFMIWKFAQKCSKLFQNALKTFFLKSTYPNWPGSGLVLSYLNQNRHFSWGVTTFIFFTPKYFGFISSKDFQRKFWDPKYCNFGIMTNFTLKIFSLYEWLSFWINLRFGCDIEFLKLIKTHPTFHRYYPCWLCLKHWLKAAFLSSRISESDDKKIGLILRY